MEQIKKIFSFVKNKPFTAIEESVVNLFSKLPKLPKEINGLIVSFGPYLVLLGGIIGILSVLTIFSIGNAMFLSVYSLGSSFIPFFYLTIISSVITGIMMVVSFEDLRKKKIFGWRLVFWAFVISALTMIITFNIIGAIISGLISFYILVSIKGSYT